MFYIGFFLLLFSAAVFFLFWKKLAFDHYFKLSSKALILRQIKSSSSLYFSTFALRKIIRLLLRFPSLKNRKILWNLALGRISSALRFLHHKKFFLEEACLQALFSPDKALSLFLKLDSVDARIEQASLLFEIGRKDESALLFSLIDIKCCSPYFRAKAFYYLAQFALTEGDMAQAFEKSSLAAILFRKNKAFIEEGFAYLLSANIFRLSASEDVSHMMFRQAIRLFQRFSHPAGEADAWGGLGMLWTMRENFDDALSYFQKSFDLNQTYSRPLAAAYILTQKALTLLLKKNYSLALETAQSALEAHLRNHDENGQAFTHEINAYIFCDQNLWNKALIEAQAAVALYQNGKDVASLSDSLYLLARIQFELNDLNTAEFSLRTIIELANQSPSCFHVANAYSLLGLLFLQKNELQRAKSLFFKSAGLEQKDERFNGAATDYTNIALIEDKLGHTNQALKTLETALRYATVFEETELAQIIRNKIQLLQSKTK